MHFVDNHKTKIRKHGQTAPPAVGQQAFQRFRGNLQNALRILHQLFLPVHGSVSMPFCHRDIGIQKQQLQAFELIVDQGFQGRDVYHPHGGCRVIVQLREHGKKRGLRLAGSRARGQQQIIVAVENHLAGRHLVAVKLLPFILIDKILYKRRKPGECVHFVPPRGFV